MPRSLCQLQSLKTRRPPLSPGMTLVELLVVMLISMIVLMAAVTVYKTGVTYYLKTDSMLTRNQDLRIALYNISRDVRMAGNGLTLMGPQVTKVQAWVPGRETKNGSQPQRTDEAGWFRHADITGDAPEELGVRAIFGVDGGAEGPDTLTIFRAEVEYGVPLGQLSNYNVGRIQLREDFAEDSLRAGDIVALVDGAQATLLEVDGGGVEPGEFLRAASNFSVKLGGRYTPPSDRDINFQAGANIYNLRNVSLVTYYVDQPNRRLMADYHDVAVLDPESGKPAPVVVADDIEDFQVYYYHATDRNVQLANTSTQQNPSISSSTLNNPANRVRAVALGLVAASDRETAADGSEPAVRPALFNRQAGTEADRRPRQTMIELVSLRNFQQ